VRERKKIRKTLLYSFWDGVFASGMSGLTSEYIAAYALVLKATNKQIALLGAIPSFVSSILQLKSADVAEKIKSRKKVIVFSFLVVTLTLIPITLTPYLFRVHPVPFLIFFVTAFISMANFAMPVWSGLMSEYIPYRMRGRYFGWRNKILNMVAVGAAYLAGIILHHFKHDVLKGFLLIFSLAFIFRSISWYFLTRMYEPVFKPSQDSYFTLLDFIKRLRHSNFAKFTLFVASIYFCVNLAAPFFSVLMLRELKFNYLVFTVLVTTVTISQILTFSRWGIIADRVGNIKVLKTTSLVIASIPLWWIIGQNPLYLIFIQILSGIAWGGFNLCASNFIYDAVTPAKRIRCIAYFNVFTALASFLGAGLGGNLVGILPKVFAYRILSIFFISSLLRFSVVLFFARRIQEVRETQKVATRDLFYSLIGLNQNHKKT